MESVAASILTVASTMKFNFHSRSLDEALGLPAVHFALNLLLYVLIVFSLQVMTCVVTYCGR